MEHFLADCLWMVGRSEDFQNCRASFFHILLKHSSCSDPIRLLTSKQNMESRYRIRAQQQQRIRRVNNKQVLQVTILLTSNRSGLLVNKSLKTLKLFRTSSLFTGYMDVSVHEKEIVQDKTNCWCRNLWRQKLRWSNGRYKVVVFQKSYGQCYSLL